MNKLILIPIILLVTIGLVFSSINMDKAYSDTADVWCDLGSTICDDSWVNRFEIVIDNGKVSGSSDLTNFPIMVSVTGSTFTDNLDDGADTLEDIRFLNQANDTLLDYEIEKFDKTTNELIAWVNIPTLSTSSDTIIYMYYDNAGSPTDKSDDAGTWSNGYVAVWHMNVADPSVTDSIVDSTGNGHHGTGVNMGVANSVDGKIGRAIEFNGIDERITIPDSDDFSLTGGSPDQPFTLSGWMNQDSGTQGSMISKASSFDAGEWYVLANNDGFYNSIVDDSSSEYERDFTNTRATQNQDNHIVMTYNGNGNWIGIDSYENGSVLASSASSTPSYVAMENTSQEVVIGARGSAEFINGVIDEIRISDVIRSADWITTTYNNIDDPSTFISISEESILNNLQAQIDALVVRVTTNEDDIVALQAADVIMQAEIDTTESDIVVLQGNVTSIDTRLDVIEAQPVRTILISLSNGQSGTVTANGIYFTEGVSTTNLTDALKTAPLGGMDGTITNFVFSIGVHDTPDFEVKGTLLINDVESSITCSIPTNSENCTSTTTETVTETDQVLVKAELVYTGEGSPPTSSIGVEHKKAAVIIES